jgi:transcriptional regulator with XRE-family HTH domain
MANRERRIERAAWLMERDLRDVAAELRQARLRSGLTLQSVALAVGATPSTVLRHETARTRGVTPDSLARHAAALGMRVRIRVYPEGAPIRDAAHVALIRRLRERLGSHVGWAFEVPIPIPGDRRAFDAVLTVSGGRVGIEFYTRLADVQDQLRRVHLKQRDAGLDRAVVVLRATVANRLAVREAEPVIAEAFPGGTRRTLAALQEGRLPESNGVVLL